MVKKVKSDTGTVCEKCGKAAGRIGEFGDICANPDCHHSGKHIGACFKCGFTLISDRNEKCPRCHGKINKCRSCGASIEAGKTMCTGC